MDKWFKDILPDKDPYHNRGRDQMRNKGGPEFECLWERMEIGRNKNEKKRNTIEYKQIWYVTMVYSFHKYYLK